MGFVDRNKNTICFTLSWSICIGNDGNIYVSEFESHRIRRIRNNEIITIAGGINGFSDEFGEKSKFSYLFGICFDENENNIIIVDSFNQRIRLKEDLFQMKLNELQKLKSIYCIYRNLFIFIFIVKK